MDTGWRTVHGRWGYLNWRIGHDALTSVTRVWRDGWRLVGRPDDRPRAMRRHAPDGDGLVAACSGRRCLEAAHVKLQRSAAAPHQVCHLPLTAELYRCV